GIFRSLAFQEMREKEMFVHVRSAAYDHEQSALIDRECRTLLESSATFLSQSGAPPSFWGEAQAHYTFTRNKTPMHERTVEGKKVFLSPDEVLFACNPFSLKHLVGFGTQVTCFIPPERREAKTPSQAKSFEGVIVGYVENSRAYRVWDLEKRKLR